MTTLTDKEAIQGTLDFLKSRFIVARRLGTFFDIQDMPLVKGFDKVDLQQQIELFVRQLIQSDLFEKYGTQINHLTLTKTGRLVKDEFDWNYQKYLDSITPSNEELENRRRELVQSIEILETRVKELAENSAKQINKVVSDAQELSQKTGVSNYGEIFKTESDEFAKKAKHWFWGIILCLLLILGTSTIPFLLHEQIQKTGISELQITVSKILVLSALFFALTVCNRNYKAYKHNSIINKHRQNALLTFDVFANSTGVDTQSRQAILESVTRTIFSNQNTGYMTANESDSPNKIIEVIKGLKPEQQ